ncbi:MAG: nuclear transport factor 2 family protein [Pseudomonadota bacterium]
MTRPVKAMPLSRDALLSRATTGYFGNVGRHALEDVMAHIALDAVMRIVGRSLCYKGAAAIRAHFEEFLATYPRVDVEIYHAFADETAQRACVHFEITLQDSAGSVQVMRNANHFAFDETGLINDVLIFMTDTPGAGFAAGNSR